MQFEEYQALVKKNLSAVFSSAFALTQDLFESEKIVETVFERAYRKRGKISALRQNESKAWLVSEAAKLAGAYLLSRKCEQRTAEASRHPNAKAPHEALSSLSGVTELAQKLASMPKGEGDAAYSYYMLSEPVGVRAKRAKITYGKAKRELMRAREAIRSQLLEEAQERLEDKSNEYF